jgi:small GTP-binding protein
MEQNIKKNDHVFKLIMIGDNNVGKSCLINSFIDNKFKNYQNTTIGVDITIKTMIIRDKTIKLQIYDTAGQEKYSALTKIYYRDAHGILIVYDVSDESSFESIKTWMENVQKFAPQNVRLILVANQIDNENRCITYEQGRELAQFYKIPYFETSAKNNSNITELFEYMSILILQDFNTIKNEIKLNGCSKNKCCFF